MQSYGLCAGRQPWLQLSKRKDDPLSEAEVADLLSEVSLSPQKRFRLHQGFKDAEDGPPFSCRPGLSSLAAALPRVTQQEGLQASQAGGCTSSAQEELREEHMGEVDVASEVLHVAESPSSQQSIIEEENNKLSQKGAEEKEEKALILYRQITPPAFPRGPVIGSSLPLPLPPIGRGTGELRLVPALPGLNGAQPSFPIGPGLMRALDLSGMTEDPTAAGSARRLHRTSSCSSISHWRRPQDEEEAALDQSMEDSEEGESSQSGSGPPLAVIPWAPPLAAQPQVSLWQPPGGAVSLDAMRYVQAPAAMQNVPPGGVWNSEGKQGPENGPCLGISAGGGGCYIWGVTPFV